MARKHARAEPKRDLVSELAEAMQAGAMRLEEGLQPLGVKLADLSSDIDRLLADHPKAAVVSAFLLGFAAGRASKRLT
ncbi:MAG TPA: hypothetical protein VHA55_09980 [Pseudorhodoplanes sp.]|jgi:hypothetical protein|nr:hypothetical protein [Pseudorhodoplanes sp.]